MKKLIGAASLTLVLTLTGCSNMSTTEQRTLSGAAIGTAAGTAIGAISGNAGVGAAVGAGVGAAGGYLYDRHKDH